MLGLRAVVVGLVAGVAGSAQAEQAYGMTQGGIFTELVRFDTSNPGGATTIGLMSGLPAGHALRAIDFRPANGQLYAMSTASGGAYNFYTVDLTSGALSLVGGGVIGGGFGWPIPVSMDFNPVVDRIRVVTIGTRNSFRFNPDTGALVGEDTRIAYVPGDVSFGNNIQPGDVAYTNSVPGASTTTMYVFDRNLDTLVRVGGVDGNPSPNTGEGTTIGEAVPGDFLTSTSAIGMDISSATGVCYLSHDDAIDASIDKLSTINLATGRATTIGNFNVNLLDMALVISAPVGCDGIDFNGNGVFPEDADVIDFFNVLAGAECPTGTCSDIDFNNNGVFPEDADVIDFFNVLAGGECP